MTELYLRAFSRPPDAEERQRILDFLQSARKPAAPEAEKLRLARQAWEDVIAVVIDTKEFQLNR